MERVRVSKCRECVSEREKEKEREKREGERKHIPCSVISLDSLHERHSAQLREEAVDPPRVGLVAGVVGVAQSCGCDRGI